MSGWSTVLSRSARRSGAGREIRGIDIISRERGFDAEASTDLESRVFDDTGTTLDYAYELEGGTLTIRAEETDPPAYFSGDDRTLDGKWVYRPC